MAQQAGDATAIALAGNTVALPNGIAQLACPTPDAFAQAARRSYGR